MGNALRLFAVVPYVLRNGSKIGSHTNHKDRNYSTVTFGAPVLINGVRRNVGVVVRQEGKYYYKMHRKVLPNGSTFVIDKIRDIAERVGGVENNSGLSPTDSVSTDSIANLESHGNIQNSDQETTSLFDVLGENKRLAKEN